MKMLIIVCEGPTEQEFCKDFLSPLLLSYDITVATPVVKHSHGGVVSWYQIKNQLIGHLCEKDAYVTTMIDFYGIKDSFKFPKWLKSKTIPGKQERVSFLEQAMAEDLDESVRYRFIPYLQLHEFETLIFSDISAIKKNFLISEGDYGKLEGALRKYPNPEDINDTPSTAPSRRILDVIPGYDKVLDGNGILLDVGLDKMMDKCPHFRIWVEKLRSI